MRRVLPSFPAGISKKDLLPTSLKLMKFRHISLLFFTFRRFCHFLFPAENSKNRTLKLHETVFPTVLLLSVSFAIPARFPAEYSKKGVRQFLLFRQFLPVLISFVGLFLPASRYFLPLMNILTLSSLSGRIDQKVTFSSKPAGTGRIFEGINDTFCSFLLVFAVLSIPFSSNIRQGIEQERDLMTESVVLIDIPLS